MNGLTFRQDNRSLLWRSPLFLNDTHHITARYVASIDDENAGSLSPISNEGVADMRLRRRFKQSASLKDRLEIFAAEARDQASHLPAGIERHTLLAKARQADTAAHIDDWVNSPGLQPPK